MRRLLLILLALFAATPASGFGQTSQPAVEVRGAFGLSHYLHGDLGYSAPTWLAAVRVGRGALVFEPEFASARHQERQVFGPAPGSSGQTVTVSTDTYRSAALNVLGRWGSSASVFAGGGPGFYWERSEYRVEAAANGYEQKRTRGPRLGAQMLAGVDIPLASRIKAFGQFRYEIRSFEDPGGGSVVQGFGGVAFALR
jgi:hypothetical protein